MFGDRLIADVYAREILDSQGNPTVEAEVLTEGGEIGRAAVPAFPAGLVKSRFTESPGPAKSSPLESAEFAVAAERRRIPPKGAESGKNREGSVLTAVEYVNSVLADLLIGENVVDQGRIDRLLAPGAQGEKGGADPVYNSGALLAVSMAAAIAGAKTVGLPLFRYLGGMYACRLPVPMMSMLSGGRRRRNLLDFREFLIMPAGAESFSQGLRMGADVYHHLWKLLDEGSRGIWTADQGGFAPDLRDAGEALDYLERASKAAGYRPGVEIFFALDAGAGDLYSPEENRYDFQGESRMKGACIFRSTEELADYYKKLAEKYPLSVLEDALEPEDWEGWVRLTRDLGGKLSLAGGDLFGSSISRLRQGIRLGAANALSLKPGRTGTLTETFRAIDLASRNGYRCIVSHRTGETEDTYLADLAAAAGAGWLKAGAPCQSERVAKYNRLVRIEDWLGDSAQYPTSQDPLSR